MQRQSVRYLFLARAVLVWFAMTLAVAMASPVVHLPSMQAVCTTDGGVRYISLHDTEDADPSAGKTHALECALCLALKEPPSVAVDVPRLAPHPLAHALTPTVSARIEALIGAPLPPRGPPAPLHAAYR